MIIEISSKDLDLLVPLGEKFYSAAKIEGYFNPGAFRVSWISLLDSGVGKIFAITENYSIIGAIGCIKYHDFNSGRLIAGEMFWFVDPEKRGHGIKLLKAYLGWSKDQGCKAASMSYLHNIMPEKLKSVYEHMGFKPVEVAYTKELV